LVLINIIGIAGVIIGTLVANVFRTVQYAVFISKNVLRRNIRDVAIRFIWVLACSAIICFLALNIENNMIFDTGWNGWIIEAIIVFLISCVVSLIMSILFYKKDLIFILNILKRMVKK
jgi:hypothetical protein